MSFQITTMIENESPTDRFSAEHGLSLLIETDGFRMLYDTGASPPFCPTSGPWERALTVWMPWPSATAITTTLAGSFPCSCLHIAPVVYYGAHFLMGVTIKKQDGMLDIGADIMPELFPCCGVSGVIVGSAPVKLHENRRHTTNRCPSRIGKDHRERLYAPSLFMQLMKHRFFRYFFRNFDAQVWMA